MRENVACRFFVEQLALIMSLPEEEGKEVLYNVMKSSFNNQIENRFPVSVSVSVSVLGKSIQDLLTKNIVWKNFSNNYGGYRKGAGRKNNPQEINQDTENNQFIKLSDCNNNKLEDNPYPTPQDNPQDNRKDNPEDNSLITRTRTINKKEIYKEKFEVFWSLYPKQRAGSKQKAYNSFVKAIQEKRTTPDWLIESVKKYAESKVVKDGYAKGCSAWLNDDRFNDEYKDVAQSDTPQRKKFVVQYDLEEINREITPEEVMIPAAYVGVK